MFDLAPISNMVADAALGMGGTDVLWYEPIMCPNVRDDGSPCYDENRGAPWIECPVCGGRGSIYKSPIQFKAIYTDNTNKWYPDGSGGFFKGNKTFSVPRNLDLHMLKERLSDNSRRLLRDKFEVLGRCCNPDGTREVTETLYAVQDPQKPTINSNTIYQIIEVGGNY